MSHTPPAIHVESLTYVYPSPKSSRTFAREGIQALKDINLTVRQGEFIGIIGQNGAGKTTLLKSLVGLLHPTAGRVIVQGMDTRQVTVSELSMQVGFVLQNPDQQLFASTVEEEIAFGPHNLGLPKTEIRERVDAALALTGLEAFRAEFPPALAKGDRAKVVIASVLAMRPQIVILDEPTTGQDYRGCHQIMQIARQLHRGGHTVLVVTHHMALITEYTQRVVALCGGRVLLDDTTAAVFAQPEILRQTHVAPPQITQLSQMLPRALGLPPCALTVEELGQPIAERVRQRLLNV